MILLRFLPVFIWAGLSLLSTRKPPPSNNGLTPLEEMRLLGEQRREHQRQLIEGGWA